MHFSDIVSSPPFDSTRKLVGISVTAHPLHFLIAQGIFQCAAHAIKLSVNKRESRHKFNYLRYPHRLNIHGT